MTAKTRAKSTVAEEMMSGKRNTPDFALPTLLLATGLYVIYIAATWAAMVGTISYLLAAAINTLVIYAIYTPVHEAVHGNISLRKKHLRWIDTLIGHAGCFPLFLFYYQHSRQHMVHHTHDNTEDDPDIYARGGFWGWLFIRLPKALISYFNPIQLYRECQHFDVPKRQTTLTMVTFVLQASLLIVILAAGYGVELLVFWFIPWWIGNTVMLTLFTWTPHHDHSETGRYRDTRESLFPFANFLLLGQNHHLIHHMMPGVPFYRYKATFNDIRPLLEQNNARIEGFWPRPKKRPRV